MKLWKHSRLDEIAKVTDSSVSHKGRGSAPPSFTASESISWQAWCDKVTRGRRWLSGGDPVFHQAAFGGLSDLLICWQRAYHTVRVKSPNAAPAAVLLCDWQRFNIHSWHLYHKRLDKRSLENALKTEKLLHVIRAQRGNDTKDVLSRLKRILEASN